MYRALATSAIALIAAASPVLAEVTPSEVWDNITKNYADMGYEVTTGGRDEAGDTLTLTDVSIAADTPTTDVSIALPKMVLQTAGDARVRTTIEGDISVDMMTEVPDQDAIDIRVLISVPGNEMLSSGSIDEMLHEVVYPEMLLSARFGAAAADGSTADAPVQLSLTDVKGSQRNIAGENAATSYDMTAAKLDVNVNVADLPVDDEQGGTASFVTTATVENMTASGTMTVPEGQYSMTDNPHRALNAGMKIDGGFSAGAMSGTTEFSGTDVDGTAQSANVTFASEGSDLVMAMSSDGLTYQGTATGTTAEMMMAELPFPISYGVQEASGELRFPISKSEQPQPYRVSYGLAGLTLGDSIWNLFDPEQKLPRDPASLTIDLEGQAIVSEDLLDPALAQRMEEAAQKSIQDSEAAAENGEMPPEMDMAMPFRAETVKINQFTLDAVGAKADIEGTLDLPNGSMQPVGTISGSFVGVNALLDTLVSMGIVPQEQIMGARMMIAMFARPSESDPEQLQTEIEMREDGSIFANGQQVK